MDLQKRRRKKVDNPKVWGGFGEKKSNNGTQWYIQDRVYDSDYISPALTAFKSDYWIKVCDDMTGNVLKEIEENIKDYEEHNIEYLPISLVKYWINVLEQQLKEFEDYVYSDEKILCYSCVNCISKGIYEVECSEKGKVDVHSSCFAYWKDEVEKND